MENRKSVDQNSWLSRRLQGHEEQLSRQGAVVTSWRRYGGRRLGPYFRLVWRDAAGRQRSLYLGADCSLAKEVQCWLQRLQAARDEQRQLNRLGRRLRRELARQRVIQRRELAKFGLTLKGAEVRGWRDAKRAMHLMDITEEQRTFDDSSRSADRGTQAEQL